MNRSVRGTLWTERAKLMNTCGSYLGEIRVLDLRIYNTHIWCPCSHHHLINLCTSARHLITVGWFAMIRICRANQDSPRTSKVYTTPSNLLLTTTTKKIQTGKPKPLPLKLQQSLSTHAMWILQRVDTEPAPKQGLCITWSEDRLKAFLLAYRAPPHWLYY